MKTDKAPKTTPAVNDAAIRPGRWVTKGGGQLWLDIAPDGLVTGRYATTHGRPEPDEFFPVTGWVNNDLIGLAVSWQQYRSMTTWCGRLAEQDGVPVINYMWHLARTFEDRAQTVSNELTFTFHTMSGTFYYEGDGDA